MRTFTPVGRITQEVETDEQKLQRMARASLPKYVDVEEKRTRQRQHCACGADLHAAPKIRQGQPVCDDCADKIPRLPAGRRPSRTCAGCHAVTPRLKMKMKNRELYCKKCLKIKFGIDF
jgi:hypothetical protein